MKSGYGVQPDDVPMSCDASTQSADYTDGPKIGLEKPGRSRFYARKTGQ